MERTAAGLDSSFPVMMLTYIELNLSCLFTIAKKSEYILAYTKHNNALDSSF